MATIECCEVLSDATKAKLQDAGLLYTTDVTRLVTSEQTTVTDRQTQSICANLRHRVREHLRSHDNSALSANANGDAEGSPFADPLVATPIDQLAFFTDGEVQEVALLVRRDAAVAPHHFVSQQKQEEQNNANASVSSGVTGRDAHNVTVPGEEGKVSGTPQAAPVLRIPGCRSLREIVTEVHQRQRSGLPSHATTFSRTLDACLGGGVAVGGVTEVSGPPGVGKTQLMMQLAVSAVMPVEFGGLGGACLFVDTEGSFVAERLEQMATAAVSLVQAIAATESSDMAAKRAHEKGNATLEKVRQSSSHRDSSSKKRPRGEGGEGDANEHGGRAGTSVGTGGEPTSGGARLVGEARADLRHGRDQRRFGDFTVEAVLERVHYVRLTELTEFLAFLYSLPAWLNSQEHRCGQEGQLSHVKDVGNSRGNGSIAAPEKGHADAPVRMILIDSVALPFRSTDAFDKNASVYDTTSNAGPYANQLPGVTPRQTSAGALSKQGLWQRSRLLYQCSTTLEQLAATHAIAVVVSNHMTSKILRADVSGLTHSLGTLSDSVDGKNEGASRQAVLIPALGDAWAHGLSTRLLLSYHHYDLPLCAFAQQNAEAATEREGTCLEDVVYATASAAASGVEGGAAAAARIVQHRVGRLLKGSGLSRTEVCFLVTSKGIRDVRHDMVKQRTTQQPATRPSFFAVDLRFFFFLADVFWLYEDTLP